METKNNYFYVFLGFCETEETGRDYCMGCVGAESIENAEAQVRLEYEGELEYVVCMPLGEFIDFSSRVGKHVGDSKACFAEVTGHEYSHIFGNVSPIEN